MLGLLNIVAVIAIVIFGLSYLAVIFCFLWYHNQLFNHVLYEDKFNDGIVFGNYGVEELPDSIEIDDLIDNN